MRINLRCGNHLRTVPGTHQKSGCFNVPAQLNIAGLIAYDKARPQVEFTLLSGLFQHAWTRFAAQTAVIWLMRAIIDRIHIGAFGLQKITHSSMNARELCYVDQSTANGGLISYHNQSQTKVTQEA